MFNMTYIPLPGLLSFLFLLFFVNSCCLKIHYLGTQTVSRDLTLGTKPASLIKQSGDKSKRKFHGSSLVRSHLYVWAVCMVAPCKHGYKIKGDIGKQLSDRDRELRINVKGKDSLMRILFKATRMLFYELLNELKN